MVVGTAKAVFVSYYVCALGTPETVIEIYDPLFGGCV